MNFDVCWTWSFFSLELAEADDKTKLEIELSYDWRFDFWAYAYTNNLGFDRVKKGWLCRHTISSLFCQEINLIGIAGQQEWTRNIRVHLRVVNEGHTGTNLNRWLEYDGGYDISVNREATLPSNNTERDISAVGCICLPASMSSSSGCNRRFLKWIILDPNGG